VENLKALIEVETGIPLASQSLLYYDQELKDNDKLSTYGVKENDVLILKQRQQLQQR
jgi:hypothetical protein